MTPGSSRRFPASCLRENTPPSCVLATTRSTYFADAPVRRAPRLPDARPARGRDHAPARTPYGAELTGTEDGVTCRPRSEVRLRAQGDDSRTAPPFATIFLVAFLADRGSFGAGEANRTVLFRASCTLHCDNLPLPPRRPHFPVPGNGTSIAAFNTPEFFRSEPWRHHHVSHL